MKRKTVTIELTQNQAETLWWLIAGEIGRDAFDPRTMRKFINIGRRVSKALGYEWRH